MRQIEKPGLYMVIEGDEVIYIGKTGRTGNIRLTEMATDYRSHTLNRKLLKIHLERALGQSLVAFNKDTKKNMIESNTLQKEQFILGQKAVNQIVTSLLKYKFYEIPLEELTSLEHFAIAILKPKYND